MGGSVIDADYRRFVSIIFFNFSNRCIEIEKGNRFAQMLFHKIANHPVLGKVENFEDNSQRGERFLGSTGIRYVCRQEHSTSMYLRIYPGTKGMD